MKTQIIKHAKEPEMRLGRRERQNEVVRVRLTKISPSNWIFTLGSKSMMSCNKTQAADFPLDLALELADIG